MAPDSNGVMLWLWQEYALGAALECNACHACSAHPGWGWGYRVRPKGYGTVKGNLPALCCLCCRADAALAAHQPSETGVQLVTDDEVRRMLQAVTRATHALWEHLLAIWAVLVPTDVWHTAL